MAYNTKELEKQSLDAIEKHKLFFIEDVISYLPCSNKTFYDHKLHELQTIKDALLKVRTDIKVSMRSKWYKSNAPALQLALMKLICTDDERKKLSMQYTENHTKLEVKEYEDWNDEQLIKELNRLETK